MVYHELNYVQNATNLRPKDMYTLRNKSTQTGKDFGSTILHKKSLKLWMQSVVKINFANQIASMKFWNNSQKTPKGSKG